MNPDRLSKILAYHGVASRRKCEELIFAGRIKVNGEVITKPQHKVDPKKDQIYVDDRKLTKKEKRVYYILNKPKGYVCSHQKDRFKKVVIDLFPDKHRLFTVGRLDKNTTGLLIVTNDGQLANRIIHPRYEVSKEYCVKTHQDLTYDDLEKIRSGARIEDAFVKPQKVTKVRKNTVKVTLTDGKKHEVRILVEQTGQQVIELERIRIGNLRLGNLGLGQYKEVSIQDLDPVFE